MRIIKDNTAGVLEEVRRRSTAALAEIAPEIVGEAKRIVPVVTGDLQRSISAEVSGPRLVVGSPLVYAPIVESNTPYLRPALEAVKGKIRSAFKI